MPGFSNGTMYADNLDFTGSDQPSAQMTADGELIIGNAGTGRPTIGALASADSSVGITVGGGTIDLSSLGLDQDNILYVGKYGNDANDGKTPSKAKLTIQAAVTAAAAGDTIAVYPGTYTETITHAANNLTIIGIGKPNTCIITQADANVVNFSTYTGIQYKYFTISCTAATTAIWTVEGSTGSCSFKECQLSMTTSANIAAADQPGVGRITGAGTLTVVLGKAYYYHTGNGGGTALKAAFETANGGLVDIKYLDNITITNSGTALASSLCIDLATTGNIQVNDSHITVTDPNATNVVGFGYLGGTGTEHEFYRNEIHVVATNNTGYGLFLADTATTTRTFYNHLHVTDVAGASYDYYVGATSTLIATFDDNVAADGSSINAAGLCYKTNKPIRGDLICSGPTAAGTRSVTVENTDNTATASNSAVNISVGGTTSTGDPFTQWLITGSTAFSAGIDNSDTDAFKIGPNVDPSTGTSALEIAAATGAITFSEAFEFPVADGTASYPLVTDGAGNLDFASLTVAGGGTGATSITDHALIVGSGTAAVTEIGPLTNGQLVIGSTGADPVAASLTAPAAGITITGGAGTVTFALADDLSAVEGLATTGIVSRTAANTWTATSITQHAVLIGAASEVPANLGPLTNGQLVIGSTGAAPVAATLTAGTDISITEGAGTITINSTAVEGLAWEEVTAASDTIAAGEGFITNRGTLVTVTLPATAAIGDTFGIINKGAGFVNIAQNAGDQIIFGNQSTTAGVGGSLQATAIGDCVEIVAYSTNEFYVRSSIGNWTVN